MQNLPVGRTNGKTDLNKRGRQPELDYSPTTVEPDKLDAARRVVAANSLDAQDARELLGALGLLPGQGDWHGCNSEE